MSNIATKELLFAFFTKKGNIRRSTRYEREVFFRFADKYGLDLNIVENINNTIANYEAFMLRPKKGTKRGWEADFDTICQALLGGNQTVRRLFPQTLDMLPLDIKRVVGKTVKSIDWHESIHMGVRTYIGLRVTYKDGMAEDWATRWLSHVVYKRPVIVTADPERIWIG